MLLLLLLAYYPAAYQILCSGQVQTSLLQESHSHRKKCFYSLLPYTLLWSLLSGCDKVLEVTEHRIHAYPVPPHGLSATSSLLPYSELHLHPTFLLSDLPSPFQPEAVEPVLHSCTQEAVRSLHSLKERLPVHGFWQPHRYILSYSRLSLLAATLL